MSRKSKEDVAIERNNAFIAKHEETIKVLRAVNEALEQMKRDRKIVVRRPVETDERGNV